MQRLVRTVVEPADDVRDPEVDVVDDAREVICRAAVGPKQSDPVEALAELRAGFAVAAGTFALPYRPLVPLEPQPLEVPDDLLLPARNVPRRIGVVDPQQHPVAQRAVRDGAESVPDMQRTRRTWSKAHSFHP